ncbi:DUF6129 family protein [Thalassospira sp. MA62]|nr:DUF6129 family protein [Thalassospira sp. MA62]
MAIKTDELAEIDKMLSEDAASPCTFADLRRSFPHLFWVRCDASDVSENPFRTIGDVDLHLIDSSAHCVEITSNLENATGFILAQREKTQ